MKYSYIKPRKKHVLSSELQLLFSFFSITLFMLFITYLFLVFKDYRFIQNTQEIVEKRAELESGIINMKAQITFIEKEVLLCERINTKNTVLKDSIANLFDLVPQRITLSEASLLKNGLILYGITPNKDVYNFMLQAPLRSIFHRTYSSFYPAPNGWLKFVSTNYIDEDELELELEPQMIDKKEEESDNEN
ncbi:hypothetical protein SMGD1_1800 [Sulfurimonas gotlandica GD1]|jgi:hypothetical protein|uniref:Uncharacterized protein n=1 Tax=Sulfurimonas gotlandica (strain DSM 19862 / JCM 16533 / GD1) TaxID=929558 RepID=B6BIG9_SULGG|nr:hypothetical protein [Sulfurimonas gotlandica]EDZ62879.1 conserved hypothetical protein [Sulfurimonas gotlandica GD1]EHP30323.1 hypothetical protein SMGD1_1800 [Sulfurimonas gotlandica GD1]